MWSKQADKLFFLFILIVFTGVGAQSNNSSETEELTPRHARSTNGQVKLSTPQECYRPCNGSKPLYCYYKFHLEYYTTMGPACNQCRTNSFERSKYLSTCQCIIADGIEKTIFSINRQFPGPSIQVCLHDKIIVDVENAAEGTDTTIHWHGVFQNGYQYYDGVPHVTQCPIGAPNTFRYQFAADNAGTHFYHSHSSLSLIDGLQGSLVVRSPPNEEPHRSLYDDDLFDHVIFLSDWMHELSLEKFPGHYKQNLGQRADDFLINGAGSFLNRSSGEVTDAPIAFFNITSGRKYRFRVVNSFGTVCASSLAIEKHKLKVIAMDGEPVEPVTVDSIVSVSGERFDFILEGSQPSSSYWIQVRGLAECAETKITQEAVLVYDKNVRLPRTARPTFDNPLPATIVLNPLEASQCSGPRTNKICVNQLQFSKKASPTGDTPEPPANKTAKITYQFLTYNERVFKDVTTYRPFYMAVDQNATAGMMDNISYAEPTSPLISQDESLQELCTAERVPTCTKPCFCSHVLNLQKNILVDIVLCDTDPFVTLHHPFHLHGYSFKVMALREFGGRKPTSNEINQFHNDYNKALMAGKIIRPPRKDTIKIPVGGCAILRIYTNNPGWWLFHCHFLWHTLTGMNMLLHVGEDWDMPEVPDDFPICGNYVPPVYI